MGTLLTVMTLAGIILYSLAVIGLAIIGIERTISYIQSAFKLVTNKIKKD